MNNIKELRDELGDNFMQLKKGSMEVKEVEAMNNTAGKMIQTVALELKKIEISQTDEKISFLEYSSQLAEKNGVAEIEA